MFLIPLFAASASLAITQNSGRLAATSNPVTGGWGNAAGARGNSTATYANVNARSASGTLCGGGYGPALAAAAARFGVLNLSRATVLGIAVSHVLRCDDSSSPCREHTLELRLDAPSGQASINQRVTTTYGTALSFRSRGGPLDMWGFAAGVSLADLLVGSGVGICIRVEKSGTGTTPNHRLYYLLLDVYFDVPVVTTGPVTTNAPTTAAVAATTTGTPAGTTTGVPTTTGGDSNPASTDTSAADGTSSGGNLVIAIIAVVVSVVVVCLVVVVFVLVRRRNARSSAGDNKSVSEAESSVEEVALHGVHSDDEPPSSNYIAMPSNAGRDDDPVVVYGQLDGVASDESDDGYLPMQDVSSKADTPVIYGSMSDFQSKPGSKRASKRP
jgi:hypothetical protein